MKKPPEGGSFILLTAHPLQTAQRANLLRANA